MSKVYRQVKNLQFEIGWAKNADFILFSIAFWEVISYEGIYFIYLKLAKFAFGIFWYFTDEQVNSMRNRSKK